MHWFPDWGGKTVAIIASGPSLTKHQVRCVRGLPSIAVNTSWQAAPWAEVLYACDYRWWKLNRGAAGFPGIKVGWDERIPREWPEVNLITLPAEEDMHKISLVPGIVGSGGNGGFQALNLAIQFGPPKRIILLGYDMHRRDGSHWHGDHPVGLVNPAPGNMELWVERYEANADFIREIGVEVINCSPSSAIRCFPVMTVEEALRRDQ